MNNAINNASKLFKFFHIDLCGNADYSDLSLNDIKDAIRDIAVKYQDQIALNVVTDFFDKCELYDSKALELLNTSLKAVDCSFTDLEYYEFFDLWLRFIDIYRNHESDIFFDDLPTGEVRIIHENEIDQLWHKELIEQIKECYDLSEVPDFIVINWDQTAENCKVDGRGHHFASYDGEEHFCNGFYIFRTS